MSLCYDLIGWYIQVHMGLYAHVLGDNAPWNQTLSSMYEEKAKNKKKVCIREKTAICLR